MKNLFRNRIKGFIFLVIALATITFTACSDEEDEIQEYIYALTDFSIHGNDVGIFSFPDSIKGIYYKQLGINDYLFDRKGSAKRCDEEVINACLNAEAIVDSIQTPYTGDYTVLIINKNTDTEIYRKKFVWE